MGLRLVPRQSFPYLHWRQSSRSMKVQGSLQPFSRPPVVLFPRTNHGSARPDDYLSRLKIVRQLFFQYSLLAIGITSRTSGSQFKVMTPVDLAPAIISHSLQLIRWLGINPSGWLPFLPNNPLIV